MWPAATRPTERGSDPSTGHGLPLSRKRALKQTPPGGQPCCLSMSVWSHTGNYPPGSPFWAGRFWRVCGGGAAQSHRPQPGDPPSGGRVFFDQRQRSQAGDDHPDKNHGTTIAPAFFRLCAFQGPAKKIYLVYLLLLSR